LSFQELTDLIEMLMAEVDAHRVGMRRYASEPRIKAIHANRATLKVTLVRVLTHELNARITDPQ
jgi:hypothetical protein